MQEGSAGGRGWQSECLLERSSTADRPGPSPRPSDVLPLPSGLFDEVILRDPAAPTWMQARTGLAKEAKRIRSSVESSRALRSAPVSGVSGGGREERQGSRGASQSELHGRTAGVAGGEPVGGRHTWVIKSTLPWVGGSIGRQPCAVCGRRLAPFLSWMCFWLPRRRRRGGEEASEGGDSASSAGRGGEREGQNKLQYMSCVLCGIAVHPDCAEGATPMCTDEFMSGTSRRSSDPIGFGVGVREPERGGLHVCGCGGETGTGLLSAFLPTSSDRPGLLPRRDRPVVQTMISGGSRRSSLYQMRPLSLGRLEGGGGQRERLQVSMSWHSVGESSEGGGNSRRGTGGLLLTSDEEGDGILDEEGGGAPRMATSTWLPIPGKQGGGLSSLSSPPVTPADMRKDREEEEERYARFLRKSACQEQIVVSQHRPKTTISSGKGPGKGGGGGGQGPRTSRVGSTASGVTPGFALVLPEPNSDTLPGPFTHSWKRRGDFLRVSARCGLCGSKRDGSGRVASAACLKCEMRAHASCCAAALRQIVPGFLSPQQQEKWRRSLRCRHQLSRFVAAEGDVKEGEGMILPTIPSSASNISDTALPTPRGPLVCFINSRSGGKLGPGLISLLQRYLGPSQVHDLSRGPPEKAIRLFSRFPNSRMIACGGDGTAGWIMSATSLLLSQGSIPRAPPMTVLPLGSGNDLARSLGWSPKVDLEERRLARRIAQLALGEVQGLDQWRVTIIPEEPLSREEEKKMPPAFRTVVLNPSAPGGDSLEPLNFPVNGTLAHRSRAVSEVESVYSPVSSSVSATRRRLTTATSPFLLDGLGVEEKRQLMHHTTSLHQSDLEGGGHISIESSPFFGGQEGKENLQIGYQGFFQNYLSVGLDAKITLSFHQLRERAPHLFPSPQVNKGWYAVFGLQHGLGMGNCPPPCCCCCPGGGCSFPCWPVGGETERDKKGLANLTHALDLHCVREAAPIEKKGPEPVSAESAEPSSVHQRASKSLLVGAPCERPRSSSPHHKERERERLSASRLGPPFREGDRDSEYRGSLLRPPVLSSHGRFSTAAAVTHSDTVTLDDTLTEAAGTHAPEEESPPVPGDEISLPPVCKVLVFSNIPTYAGGKKIWPNRPKGKPLVASASPPQPEESAARPAGNTGAGVGPFDLQQSTSLPHLRGPQMGGGADERERPRPVPLDAWAHPPMPMPMPGPPFLPGIPSDPRETIALADEIPVSCSPLAAPSGSLGSLPIGGGAPSVPLSGRPTAAGTLASVGTGRPSAPAGALSENEDFGRRVHRKPGPFHWAPGPSSTEKEKEAVDAGARRRSTSNLSPFPFLSTALNRLGRREKTEETTEEEGEQSPLTARDGRSVSTSLRFSSHLGLTTDGFLMPRQGIQRLMMRQVEQHGPFMGEQPSGYPSSSMSPCMTADEWSRLQQAAVWAERNVHSLPARFAFGKRDKALSPGTDLSRLFPLSFTGETGPGDGTGSDGDGKIATATVPSTATPQTQGASASKGKTKLSNFFDAIEENEGEEEAAGRCEEEAKPEVSAQKEGTPQTTSVLSQSAPPSHTPSPPIQQTATAGSSTTAPKQSPSPPPYSLRAIARSPGAAAGTLQGRPLLLRPPIVLAVESALPFPQRASSVSGAFSPLPPNMAGGIHRGPASHDVFPHPHAAPLPSLKPNRRSAPVGLSLSSAIATGRFPSSGRHSSQLDPRASSDASLGVEEGGRRVGGMGTAELSGKSSSAFVPPQMDDRRLEVMAFDSACHGVMTLTGLAKAKPLVQAGRADLRMKEALPMQIDGEPWLQVPCRLVIEHFRTAEVMCKPKAKAAPVSRILSRLSGRSELAGVSGLGGRRPNSPHRGRSAQTGSGRKTLQGGQKGKKESAAVSEGEERGSRVGKGRVGFVESVGDAPCAAGADVPGDSGAQGSSSHQEKSPDGEPGPSLKHREQWEASLISSSAGSVFVPVPRGDGPESPEERNADRLSKLETGRGGHLESDQRGDQTDQEHGVGEGDRHQTSFRGQSTSSDLRREGGGTRESFGGILEGMEGNPASSGGLPSGLPSADRQKRVDQHGTQDVMNDRGDAWSVESDESHMRRGSSADYSSEVTSTVTELMNDFSAEVVDLEALGVVDPSSMTLAEMLSSGAAYNMQRDRPTR
uniref:diacylglycerol kinase (ATP) n=1 Tax=Chromera velia CCMP2878 TaxID=1169474 RepID=A0A0G4HXS0_9ALVE|eukprot:Cvel_9325.t1-p1 / transcript=Cvel_9325.t1 / gene=Cvel_9325 / organism=Chromera_velia_CCMP2878 / gene_product=Diacylglycerol kinase alpha, putative / transcript_product=Diacylglycerol kinase alpha, putative / location=Cvel_scaffold535:8736-16432(-) / protein_length=2133 / sequence_SO=supercontig / SO=protein_coding / is_pseudo=false